MIKGIVQTIKRYLPEKVRLHLYFLTRQNFITYFKIKKQLKNDRKIRLLIGYEGKKPGWFSIGFKKQNDIRINQKIQKIQIKLPIKCVEEIYIDDFLRKLNREQVYSLLSECFRVLVPSGVLTIKSFDARKAITKFISVPSYFTTEPFWNRDVILDELVPFNVLSSLLVEEGSRYLLDTDTIVSLLQKFKFDIDKIYNNQDGLFTFIVSKKNDLVSSRIITHLPKANEIQNDIPVYLYNCDSVSILEKFKSIDLSKLQGRAFASVIGSMFFLNLIPYLKPKKIYLFDVNEYQVRYMKVFIDILRYSNNFNEFLEDLFSRPFQKNISQFLQTPFNKKIYNQNLEKVADKEIFELTFGKIAKGKYVLLDDAYPALKISNNSMCQHILIMSKELFIPGPEANVVLLHEGLADYFDYIKTKLIEDTIIEIKTLQDDETINFVQEQNGVIYVSNIGESDWLKGNFMDQDLEALKVQSCLLKYPEFIKKQIIESFIGFHDFIKKIRNNFWIIDSKGNIFNSQELLKERSDSHSWLWQKVRPLILDNKTIEVIHLKKGQWGFKEYLSTVNVDDYLNGCQNKVFTTIIFHMLLSNKVNVEVFEKVLKIASKRCKRIIILEHDKDSVNFGAYSGYNTIDIKILLRILRSIPEIQKSEIKICWSGSSHRVDEEIYGDKANFNRNFIITIDL